MQGSRRRRRGFGLGCGYWGLTARPRLCRVLFALYERTVMQIEIDFDVWKALTVRRETENVSYNDVLRNLLQLKIPTQVEPLQSGDSRSGGRSFHSRGLVLPHGTKLRATYKGRSYLARIEDGEWIDDSGLKHSSPSAAARHITGSNVNGLRFWQGNRPDVEGWLSLDSHILLS